MKKILAAATVLAALFPGSAWPALAPRSVATARVITETVAGTRIVVPSPLGFVPLEHRDNPTWRLMSVGGENLLREVWYDPRAAADVRAGGEANTTLWFTLGTPRTSASTKVDLERFARLRRAMHEEQERIAPEVIREASRLLESGADRYGKELGIQGFALKVGEPLLLGVFDDQEDRIATGAVVPRTTTSQGDALEEFVATVTYAVRLRGRLIYLSTSMLITRPGEVEVVRATAKLWVNGVIAANRAAEK